MSQPPTAVRRVGKMLGLFVIVLLIWSAGASIGLLFGVAADNQSAIVVGKVSSAKSVTYRGGRIEIYESVSDVRDCPTTSTRWLWTWVKYRGHRVKLYVLLTERTDGLLKPGLNTFLLSFRVPKGVFDGTWYYMSTTASYCGRYLYGLVAPQITEIDNIPIVIKSKRPA
jgi:hypothetical protein